MKKKILNSFFVLKALTALVGPLFIIEIFELTKSPIHVGLMSFCAALGTITGSIYWGKYSRSRTFVYGFLSLFFLSFLFTKNIILIYLSAYYFYFFNISSYLALLNSPYFRKGTRQKLSKLEEKGGFAWLIGLILGLITKFAQTEYIVILVQTIGIATLLYSYKTLRKEFRREVGKGIILVERVISYSPYFTYTLFLFTLKSFSLFNKSMIKLRKPKEMSFHLPFILFFIGTGIVLAQVITFIKSAGFDNSVVYLSLLVASSFSIIGYRIARTLSSLTLIPQIMIIARAFIFPLFFFLTFLKGTPFLLLLIFLRAFQGFSWGILAIWFNSLVLKLRRSALGTNLALRNISASLANAASGFLLELYTPSIFLLSLIFFVASAIKFKQLVGRKLAKSFL